mmetsp:Transcript_44036/g.116422  ORF Transcript_44036/g.116422 Transcript_44036/m.116422 type:complete len:212 (-) Transcript_44036:125-760(-)
MTIALRHSGFFMQKARPPCRWPVTAARAAATRKPEKLVHSIDSCIVGLAFGLSGLSFFVLTFTLSCSPPVTASISSEKAISSRPYDESLAPPPFFLPPKLKMHTPSVIITTCTYSIVVYFLPPSSRPPAITGTILHDLPSTCVANETYRRASLEPAIASICEMPELKISLCGILQPDDPSASTPTSAMPALIPRSTASARKVNAKRSCSSP